MNKKEILNAQNQSLAIEFMAKNYFKRRILNSGKGNHNDLLTANLDFFQKGWNLTQIERLEIAKSVMSKFRELKAEFSK